MASEAPPGVLDDEPRYPSRWEADVVLRDGGTAHLRPIGPQDAERLQAFHLGQSDESIYLRFFAPMPRLSDRDLHRFTHVDHHDRVAFVCLVGERIVGIGRYDRITPDSAEVAFNVSDAHQGRGVSSVLLEHLAAAARENGIRRFVAEVLPRNRKMLLVFREAGYEVSQAYEDGVVSVHFDIDPTERSRAVMEGREHRAEARSTQRLLNPASVALIGASRRPGTVGHLLLQNLVAGRFTGRLHVVHPEARKVLGVPAFPRVQDIGEPVDLAVIAVPAAKVLDVVRDCAEHGVGGLLVVSAGFAEDGEEGVERQRELVRLARANGMRVVGPNSWGMINADPASRLNVSLIPDVPRHGRFGVFCQSGALSVSVLDAAERWNMGLSTFLSAGNRADVSGNDCLQYWEEDTRTDVIGLYLESIGNPRKFSRLARRVSRSKPVVVVKSGASGFGVPPGHEVRPSRAPRDALDAMLRQSGVIRVENVHQMLGVAQLLRHQPLPAGNRVAVVGNSDALGALIADAALDRGLQVTHGPVSLHPQAGPVEFKRALRAAFDDPGVDSVVAAFIPPVATQAADVARTLARTAAASTIPVVACFLGLAGASELLWAGGRVVPAYGTPEEAVRALAAVSRYAGWRGRDTGRRLAPEGIDAEAAQEIVQSVLERHPQGTVLDDDTTGRLLACYGIRVWAEVDVADADTAVEAADALGYPVALKTTAAHLRHRVDLGGVRLDIADEQELRVDFAAMKAGLTPLGGADLVVQRMAPPGVACVLRSVEDPLFGPVVSFGLGGDATELLGDVAHRIPPMTDVEVHDLVREPRASPRLFGHRGAAPVDVEALEDVVARISCLADDLPEVADLELNPVVVAVEGASVLSAEIRLQPQPGRSDADHRGFVTSS